MIRIDARPPLRDSRLARTPLWVGLRALDLAHGQETPGAPAPIGGAMHAISVTADHLMTMEQSLDDIQ